MLAKIFTLGGNIMSQMDLDECMSTVRGFLVDRKKRVRLDEAWETIRSYIRVSQKQSANITMDAITAYIKESYRPVRGNGKDDSIDTSEDRREFIAKYRNIFMRLLHQ
jgi:hypothetical protein